MKLPIERGWTLAMFMYAKICILNSEALVVGGKGLGFMNKCHNG